MKSKYTVSLSLVTLACVAIAISCGKKTKSDTPTPSTTTGGTLTTQFSASKLETAQSLAALELLNDSTQKNSSQFGLADSTNSLGQSSPESFLSAKFRVVDMALCSKASDSGDVCAAGEWLLYNESENRNQSEYDTFLPAVAKTFTGWTDFLSKESVAKIASSATYSDKNVGSYESVVVHFYRPFVIKASVPMSNGETIYTKADGTFVDNGKSALDITYRNEANGKMTTGPAEDAVFFLPNGGKTFFLPRPFEITEEDVKNQVGFKMVLAYDPNGIIKGQGIAKGTAESAGIWLEGQADSTNGYMISAPFIEFSPVVARSTETIMKETYLLKSDGDPTISMSEAGPRTPFAVRVTLYYVKEDATKSVRGMTTANLLSEDSTSMPPSILNGVRKVKENSDGTLDFIFTSEAEPALKSFKRVAKGTVGTATGTVCLYGMNSDGCSASTTSPSAKKKTTLTYTYTLIGEGAIDETFAAPYVTPEPVPTATATATP